MDHGPIIAKQSSKATLTYHEPNNEKQVLVEFHFKPSKTLSADCYKNAEEVELN